MWPELGRTYSSHEHHLGNYMTHKLVLIRQTADFAEWKCPVCERHIRLGSAGSGLTILNPGDQEVNHGSATTVPELTVGNASVEPLVLH